MASGTIIASSSKNSSGSYVQAKIVWSSQADTVNNRSLVTATLYVRKYNDNMTLTTSTTGTWTYSLGIGSSAISNATISTSVLTDWVQLKSISQYVTHNSDGSKSINIGGSVIGPSGTSYSGLKASPSKTVDLDDIARASTFVLSSTSRDVGSAITATITRASSSFTHTVEFYINSSYKQTYTNIATSVSFTIPSSWYNAMPTTASITAYCSVTTYYNGTKIGDSKQATFTVTVPSTIVPTVGSITLDPTNIVINGTSYNYLINGKNKLTLSVTGSSGGAGSGIKSYAFSGPSLSTTTSSTSVSVSSVEIDANTFVDEKAVLTYEVSVTDNRSRVKKATQTITCYDYKNPSLNSFKILRSGTALTCTFTPSFSSLNEKNTANVVVYYTTGSTTKSTESITVVNGQSQSVVITLNNTTSTYQVYAEITDGLGGKSASSTKPAYGDARILNITKDGTGIALGKMAESNNLFDCKWPAIIQGFRVPEIQHGNISITPSAANTPTSKVVTFAQEFSGNPDVVVTGHTSVPGTTLLGVGTSNRSSTSCTIWITRTNTTDTTVSWIAVY